MAPPNTQIPLEVLIHKEKNRVVFAEANADFVNIVFSFLTMPMGTIVRLLSNHSKQPVIGSFNNLYRSVVNLEPKCFASKACKDMLLYPRNSAEDHCACLKINIDDIKPIEFFTIGSTEILDLLIYSILSKTPLTHMFLEKNYRFVDKSFQTVNRQLTTDLIDGFKKMIVTVLVKKSNNKILLAHSSEDFIEFLLNFLTIPLGRVVSQSSKDDAPGIQNIHRSVSDLNVGEYFTSQKVKDILVRPQLAMFYLCSDRNYPLKKEKIPKYYWSSKIETEGIYGITMGSSSANNELHLASPLDKGGFLNESTKFMVTDDLVVTPLSSMSCIEYLQSRKIATSDIEEQVIDVGMEEAKHLLKASLISTSVLTNGLKHLIRAYPYTKTLVKKLLGRTTPINSTLV